LVDTLYEKLLRSKNGVAKKDSARWIFKPLPDNNWPVDIYLIR
jgi:hypothetical protein